MPDGIIYLVTNTITGMYYVGQTIQPLTRRWSLHCTNSRRGSDLPIHKAIRMYGVGAFTREVIGGANNLAMLNDLEAMLIKEYNSLVPNGYNLASGGRNFASHPSTRAKLSAAHKGVSKSPEHRAKIRDAQKGRAFTSEHRANSIAALIGRSLSAEHRARLSAVRKGRTKRPHSAEARAKISASRKGIPAWNRGLKASEFVRAKLSATRLSMHIKASAETRAKVSASLIGNKRRLGIKHSEETKAKMRAAHVKRRQT